jgi:membrane-associated phospholipid phosphatase
MVIELRPEFGGPLLAFAMLAHAAPARADAPAEPSPIEWRFRRSHAWEYAATAVALGTGFYLRFVAAPRDANWTGGILFDDGLREEVAVKSPSNRLLVTSFTDAMFFGAMTYRFVDSLVVPGLGWGNWDTALQMLTVDLESFGFVALTLWGTQALLARQRPYVARCGEAGIAAAEDCRPDQVETNRSFYAGHPAVGMTAAMLTCVHHSHLPLYGGGAGDTVACGVMVGAAVMNGFGRVVTEKHYPSDLIVGFGVGAFAGWALPELLHYAHPRSPGSTASTSAAPVRARAVLFPSWSDGQPGVSLVGIF